MKTKRVPLTLPTRMLALAPLSKLLSPLTRRMRPWKSSRHAVLTSLRAVFCALLSILLLASKPALAGGGGGGMSGGATEVTQLLNNAQLVDSYSQQVMAYQNQLMQYATMVQNLAKNPLGITMPDVLLMANNAARIMNVGKDIASSMSRVDQNFANVFNNPTAASFATKFNLWTNAAQDGLKAAMLNAGLQREQFADDASSLQALTQKVAAANGNQAALDALGNLNARQIQESMKLRDLISQQQVAQNTYLAAQEAKDSAKNERLQRLMGPYTDDIPMPSNGRQNVFDWSKGK